MHTPVLLQEVIELLSLSPGKVFLDGTLGSGGHSTEVFKRFKDSVTLLGIDQDPDAVERSTENLRSLGADPQTKVENFRNIPSALKELGHDKVDAILLDLGYSSDQMDLSGRGFSFQREEPLDMRMGKSGLTAKDILNTWEEDTLELIIRGFGEESFSKRIAREIVLRRENHPFATTTDLLEAVRAAIPASKQSRRINPATKTFQALRIAVNEELTALEEGLEKGFESLNEGGRLAVISFHSLEDRIVKNFFKDLAKEGKGILINKKPITASGEEIMENPRSRSAKLRVIKKQ